MLNREVSTVGIDVLLGIADNLSSFCALIENLLGLKPCDIVGWDVSSSQIGFLLFWMEGEVPLMG